MYSFLDSHVEGPGSIPGRGGQCFVRISIGPQLFLAPPIMLSVAETSITIV